MWEGVGACKLSPTDRALRPLQLIYDIFNTTAVQFLFYVLYVFLFQVLIFNLRSPDEYNMSKYVFVSRQH